VSAHHFFSLTIWWPIIFLILLLYIINVDHWTCLVSGNNGDILPLRSNPIKLIQLKTKGGVPIFCSSITQDASFMSYSDCDTLRLYSITLVSIYEYLEKNFSYGSVHGQVIKVIDFKPLAPRCCGFESWQGLWILSCGEAIQLAYRTSVVLLRWLK
jgi:hypothetical protein